MKILPIAVGLAFLTLFSGCTKPDGVAEFEAAKTAFANKDFVRATKLLEKSLEYAPDNVEAFVYLSRAYLEIGELAMAKKSILVAADAVGEDIDIRLLRAQIAWHMKDYKTSAIEFQTIADDGKLSAEYRSRGWTGVGIVEMSCNNQHFARIAFIRAIRMDRRNASAWYHLGLLYRDAFGYPDAALEQFEFYVRVDEQADPRVQRVQRNAIPELKDLRARRLSELPGASKRDSAASAAAISKAEAAWKKRQFKTALNFYKTAAAADPLSYPAAVGVAKAILKVDSGKKSQQAALEAYKGACILRPSAVSTFLTAGELAMKLSLNAQAVEFYSRAIAANPASLEAIDGMIRALRKVGNKNSVASAYQRYRDSIPLKKSSKR